MGEKRPAGHFEAVKAADRDRKGVARSRRKSGLRLYTAPGFYALTEFLHLSLLSRPRFYRWAKAWLDTWSWPRPKPATSTRGSNKLHQAYTDAWWHRYSQPNWPAVSSQLSSGNQQTVLRFVINDYQLRCMGSRSPNVLLLVAFQPETETLLHQIWPLTDQRAKRCEKIIERFVLTAERTVRERHPLVSNSQTALLMPHRKKAMVDYAKLEKRMSRAGGNISAGQYRSRPPLPFRLTTRPGRVRILDQIETVKKHHKVALQTKVRSQLQQFARHDVTIFARFWNAQMKKMNRYFDQAATESGKLKPSWIDLTAKRTYLPEIEVQQSSGKGSEGVSTHADLS